MAHYKLWPVCCTGRLDAGRTNIGLRLKQTNNIKLYCWKTKQFFRHEVNLLRTAIFAHIALTSFNISASSGKKLKKGQASKT